MQILNLQSGTPFQMGKGKNWRVVHPDMGSTQLTLNHGFHAPGQEFTQHYHDASEDAIVVLEGGGAIRQGSVYTPITAGDVIFVPAGEIHGTVNTTENMARLISFQAPPDMALYRGERDTPNEIPTPQSGHRSNVQVIHMERSGPVFGKSSAPCSVEHRSVVSPQKGSVFLSLDWIRLRTDEEFTHEPLETEAIYVLTGGNAELQTEAEERTLGAHDVIFLSPKDTCTLRHIGGEPTTLIHCWAV